MFREWHLIAVAESALNNRISAKCNTRAVDKARAFIFDIKTVVYLCLSLVDAVRSFQAAVP